MAHTKYILGTVFNYVFLHLEVRTPSLKKLNTFTQYPLEEKILESKARSEICLGAEEEVSVVDLTQRKTEAVKALQCFLER